MTLGRFGNRPKARLEQVLQPTHKEVQDSSCRGIGGVPQFFSSPPRMGDLGG